MWRYLRLWRRFVIMAFVREAEYRVNFAVSVLEGIAQLALALLTFALLYRYTDTVAGWSADEALMLVGVYRAMDGLLALQVAPNMIRTLTASGSCSQRRLTRNRLDTGRRRMKSSSPRLT
jgi:ABC-2 type transport system permease protein